MKNSLSEIIRWVLKKIGLIIVLVSFFASSVLALEYKPVLGTFLEFTPVEGFHPARYFTGYENINEQITILAVEIPIQKEENFIQQIENTFTKEVLITKGISLLSKERLKEALFLKTQLQKDGIQYYQWIYWLASSSRVAQIQVTGPAANFIKKEKEIYMMLNSFRWLNVKARSDLFYSIELPPEWREVMNVGAGNLYGKFEKPSDKLPKATLAVVDLHIYVEAKDFKQKVIYLNLNRNYYSNLRIVDSTELNINGFSSNISSVSGYSQKLKKDVILQYCYISTKNRLILIETDSSDLSKESFVEIVKTFRLRD